MQGLRLGVVAVVVAAGIAVVAAPPAQAATVDFNFQSPSGNIGSSSHTYTISGISITASGFTGSIGSTLGTPTGTPNLFDKTAGGGENGLGLTNDPSGDDEITKGSYVEIKMPGSVTAVSFNMGSTTGSDAWAVWGCTTATTGCTQLLTGTNESTHSLALDAYYVFTETGVGNGDPNVLLANLNVTTTPIPAALPLFGSGLAALFAISRRKRRKAIASA